METVLVTGGNGFIGSQVVSVLNTLGFSISCLLRRSSDLDRLEGIPFTKFTGDVRDADAVSNAMLTADCCIHLASLSAWHKMDGDELEETIIHGARNVLNAAKRNSLRRVVIVSSILAINGTRDPEVFDESAKFELTDPQIRYAHAKKAAEDLIHEYTESGLEVVIVNPVETYGPNDKGLVTACNLIDFISNWPCLVTRGGTSITGIEEVSVAIASALNKGRSGERYILGGDNLSITELAKLTLQIAGKKKPIINIPLGFLRWFIPLLVRMGLPSPVVPGVLPYLGYYFYADSSKAQEELDYEPRSAVEVLTPVIEWLKQTGHING